MFHRMNRPSFQFQLKILCVLVLHLLLTHSCRGQSQLIGPSQPIVATVGDDIILPCQLQPAEDVAALAVEWTRSDLDPIYVHVRRAGQDLTHSTHPSYKNRTSLSIDGLKQGNISLKLSKVKHSDGGKYKCFILQLDKHSFVELVFATEAVSSPVISLAGIDRDRGGVVLQCESKGWYPQPEVFWLDGEGNFFSAEPTETVSGPDYLYTVSSRVTVEKRHNNNFTCRVQNTNQIRETYIIVADDLFKALSSSSFVIIGLAVSLAVSLVVSIMSIVAVFFFVWKWRQNKTKETEGGDPEMQPLNAAGPDGKTLTLKEKKDELLKEKQDRAREVKNHQKQIQTLKDNHEEAVRNLKGQHKEELEEKQAATDRLLQEEKQKREREVAYLKNQLESKQKQTQGASQHNDTNLAGKNSTEVFVLVDPNRRYLRLTTESKEDLKLEGWKLRVKVKDKNPIMVTFKESFKLRAEKKVTIWANGWGAHSPPSDLIWKDLKRWDKGDKLLVELINCDGDIVTTTETQGASQHVNIDPAGKNSTEVFVEVDPNGKYLRLTNKSKEDLKLEGWRLRVKLNDEDPIMFTFEKSFTLRAGWSVYIWAHGCTPRYPGPSDLTWKDLKRWTRGDKLLVELINCHEEIVTTTKV